MKIRIMLTLLLLSNFFYLEADARKKPMSAIDEEDKTLSPYFKVISIDNSVEQFPLKSTSANVRIEGVIADVTVKQVYKNEGKKPIEAIYVFPGSTRAAVYDMRMTIGDRILVAQIQKRDDARRTYETAKKEGKTTSLLEQERPNVFQMNVANILPGDLITVELKYTELLIPESGVYEFVYPTVVGPRYSNKSENGTKDEDKFVASPYQHSGEMPLYDFDLKINLNAGMPINDIYSSTHKISVDYEIPDKESASITLDKSEKQGGNRDFTLNYTLSGNGIKSGLILSEGTENFFLLMLQPPKKIEYESIPNREYIFVVDVSGSMMGFPLDISKQMIKELLKKLRPEDLFNIMLFAGGSEVMSCSSIPATTENVNNAIKMIEKNAGGGGTEMLPALQKVYNLPKLPGYSRSIILLTDGYVDIETKIFDLISGNLNEANVFAFGIGSAVNRFLIEGIARCGMGQPFFVTRPNQAEEKAEKFSKYIESPVLTDIQIQFDGFHTYDIEPKSIPDVFSERPIIIYGKWKDNPEGKIIVSGLFGKTTLNTIIDVRKFADHDTSKALKYLWARNRIATLGDYHQLTSDSSISQSITELGLKYNLLTQFTSFVAVDYNSRTNDTAVSVKQTLPLPEGVSDYALGATGNFSTTQALTLGSGTFNSGSGFIQRSSIAGGIEADPLEPGTVVEDDDQVDTFITVDQEPKIDYKSLMENLIYPENARKASIEGKVILRILVDKNGKVLKTSIQYSDSYLLESPALEAVSNSKFIPAIQNGIPVKCWVTLPIVFKLSDKSEKAAIKNDTVTVKTSYPKPGEIEFKQTTIGTSISSTGVEYRIINSGSGNVSHYRNKVKIHYKQFSDNCTILIDTYKNNNPVEFILGDDNKIPYDLQVGLHEMKQGEKRFIKKTNRHTKSDNTFYEVELLEIK